eukprot:g16236.t1
MFAQQHEPSHSFAEVSYLAPNYLTLFFLWILISEATAMLGRFLILKSKQFAQIRLFAEHMQIEVHGGTDEGRARAARMSNEQIANTVIAPYLPTALSHVIAGALLLPVCAFGWREEGWGASIFGGGGCGGGGFYSCVFGRSGGCWGSSSSGGVVSVFGIWEYFQNGEYEKLFVLGMMLDSASNLYELLKATLCFEKFLIWKKVDRLREQQKGVFKGNKGKSDTNLFRVFIPCHFAIPVPAVGMAFALVHHGLGVLVKHVQDLHTEGGFLVFKICVVLQLLCTVPRLLVVTYCGSVLCVKLYGRLSDIGLSIFPFPMAITTVLLLLQILLALTSFVGALHAVLHVHEKNKTAEGRASLKTPEGRLSVEIVRPGAMGGNAAKFRRMSRSMSGVIDPGVFTVRDKME